MTDASTQCVAGLERQLSGQLGILSSVRRGLNPETPVTSWGRAGKILNGIPPRQQRSAVSRKDGSHTWRRQGEEHCFVSECHQCSEHQNASVNRQDPFVDIRSPMCINSINNKRSEIPHALQAHRIASHRMAAQCNNDRTCVSPALYSTGCRSQLPGRLRRLFGSASEDAPWAESSWTSVRIGSTSERADGGPGWDAKE
ncbi:hypothetical protein CCHR01_16972 [Colletotrichum chrysophilum]|uniref:Uncharacterized protein n=1 Tax=Colletotrichum chrysophilum TaxID=1836956 RepID=A0AAD9E9J6_9PEZI|nr:hypothetical protein CCHR01_16972 [Colletotrichum chrysophilum]